MPRKTDGIPFELQPGPITAKCFLDSLCLGEKPRLYRSKEGGSWCYFVTAPSNG